MAPGPVVEDFNVIEDISSGQIPGFIDTFSDPFFFQQTEERFGHRIIPAVATPAHARCPGKGDRKNKYDLTEDELEPFNAAVDHRQAKLTMGKLYDRVPPGVWKFVK